MARIRYLTFMFIIFPIVFVLAVIAGIPYGIFRFFAGDNMASASLEVLGKRFKSWSIKWITGDENGMEQIRNNEGEGKTFRS